jgi:hypothetical protein
MGAVYRQGGEAGERSVAMKILALTSSHRRRGNTARIVEMISWSSLWLPY